MSKMLFLWISRLSIFGIALSLYTVYVEYKAHTAESDNPYVALCDISEKMSCSKVFLSEYGKIFSSLGVIPKDSALDQPNACYGILFYSIVSSVGALAHVDKISTSLAKDILLICATSSVLLSAYLSYILAEVLQDVCVVCFSTYVVNFLLFYMCSANALCNEEADDAKCTDKREGAEESETKLGTKKKKK
jgi:vitamin-K-epoxide reductase (warfarin-sensitive)